MGCMQKCWVAAADLGTDVALTRLSKMRLETLKGGAVQISRMGMKGEQHG